MLSRSMRKVSPPRARRTSQAEALSQAAHRFTSASAENIPLLQLEAKSVQRFTPASAENIYSLPSRGYKYPVSPPRARRTWYPSLGIRRNRLPFHPRERGEHSRLAFARSLCVSPPRARRTSSVFVRFSDFERFTPASAENILGRSIWPVRTSFHPRERGEHAY